MRRYAVTRGCECFIVCDIDRGEFCAGHADEGERVEGCVDDGDVHGDVDRAGFGLACFDAELGGVEGQVGEMRDCWGSFAGGCVGHGGVGLWATGVVDRGEVAKAGRRRVGLDTVSCGECEEALQGRYVKRHFKRWQ